MFSFRRNWSFTGQEQAAWSKEDLMGRKRRWFPAAQRMAIRCRHLLGKAAFSNLCQGHGWLPTSHQRWQGRFIGNSPAALQRSRAQKAWRRRTQKLESRLRRKNEEPCELPLKRRRMRMSFGESVGPRHWRKRDESHLGDSLPNACGRSRLRRPNAPIPAERPGSSVVPC